MMGMRAHTALMGTHARTVTAALQALKGRVAVTDSSRELLGLALKTLGLGYNPRCVRAWCC